MMVSEDEMLGGFISLTEEWDDCGERPPIGSVWRILEQGANWTPYAQSVISFSVKNGWLTEVPYAYGTKYCFTEEGATMFTLQQL